jgi:hypothetical protein
MLRSQVGLRLWLVFGILGRMLFFVHRASGVIDLV